MTGFTHLWTISDYYSNCYFQYWDTEETFFPEANILWILTKPVCIPIVKWSSLTQIWNQILVFCHFDFKLINPCMMLGGKSSYSLPNGKLENWFYFALLELFLSVIKYTSKEVIMAIVIAVWGPALCFILNKS